MKAGAFPATAEKVWMRVLSTFTNPAVEETVFNLRDSGFATSYWKGVAVRCADGMILALVPPTETYNYRYLLGTGPLLRELCTVPNIAYIIWEDDNGIVSAHGDYAAADDPAAHNLIEFKEPAPMQLVGGGTGIFRVGMSRAGLNRIEFESRVRMLIFIAGIIVVSGILVRSAILRRRFEKERVQRERLASVGELAAGVAHEVRNPLNAVALTLQQLSSDAVVRNTDPENATLLAIARDEVDRANMILTDFLQYARPPRLDFHETDINELCDRVIKAVQVQADSRGVTIKKQFTDRLPPVALDRVHIHQSLLNIILNALDAMPGGGTITITTRQQRSEIALSIADTGNGIAVENRERVFDLYYTTKHKGIGLGLPFVHKIITMHNGHVTINENRPTGVVVEMRLPVMVNS
jgi:signal transduction histidine kinase